MKKILLIVLPLLLIVGCSKPVNEETLIEKGGLKYHPDTKELYSGKSFINRLGGEKEFEGTYKDGKMIKKKVWNNPITEHPGHEDNAIVSEKVWNKDGKLDRYTEWYGNGQKKKERTYKDGNEDGLWTSWYVNGQKKWEKTYKDGKFVEYIGRWKEDGSVKE